MRFLVAAVVLVAFGGCSHKVTFEDLESLTASGDITSESQEELPSKLEDVKRICGEPTRELLIENKDHKWDALILAYEVDGKEFLLSFSRGKEAYPFFFDHD